MYRQWVDEVLKEESSRCEASWSESIAVGNIAFIEATQAQLRVFSTDYRIEETNSQVVLREEVIHFDPEKGPLSPENSYFCDDNAYITGG